tara:strand:- start:1520 stop:3100 length:1581 start_codon:yes stop_codon:yes gene_type:complete
MRLLRLTTENNNAIFDNNFNHDILLDKDSQVGLQNINFSLETKFIKISNTNNVITFSTDNNETTRTVRLLYKPYTELNVSDLLEDISLKMNGQLLGGDATELGKMWKVRIVDDRIQTEVKTSNLNFRSIDWTIPSYSNISISGNDSTPVYNRIITNIIASTTANTNLLYNDTQSLTRGCGTMRIAINKLIDNLSGVEDNGFTFGVAKTPPSEWGITGIPDSQMKYAIKIHKHSDNYSVYKDGTGWVETDKGYLHGGGSDSSQFQQDEISVQVSEGQILISLDTFNITTENLDTYTLLGKGATGGGDSTDILVDSSDLYPFIVIRGVSPNFSLRDFVINLNPYGLSKNNTYPPVNHGAFQSERYNNSNSNIMRKIPAKPLTIPIPPEFIQVNYSAELADFLGYNNSSQPQPMKSPYEIKEFEFIGEDYFYINQTGLYLLELLDIDLESYDGLTNNRRNIIATLPVEVKNNIVIYEPANVNFINIKNANKRALRNIKARILTTALDTVNIKGLATATLLIRDGADRGF